MLKDDLQKAKSLGAQNGAIVAIVTTGSQSYIRAVAFARDIEFSLDDPTMILHSKDPCIHSAAEKAVETVFTNTFSTGGDPTEYGVARSYRENCWDSPVSCISDDAVGFRLIGAAMTDLTSGNNFSIADEIARGGWSEAHVQKDAHNPDGVIYRSAGMCCH